jgi:Domain of unknown function (DUF4160)
MPTIFTESGFRFMIYVHGHAPPHVPIHGSGGVVELMLETLKLKGVRGNISNSDVRKVMAIAAKHQDELLAAWENHHG